MQQLGRDAVAAQRVLAISSGEQRNRALHAIAAALRAAPGRDSRGQRTRHECGDRRRTRTRGTGSPATRCRAHRSHGSRGRGHRGAARSDRHGAGRMDAPERPALPARARAARRHRHHLREPSERDLRCRRAVPQVGECGDPARRQREPPFERRDPRLPGRRACVPRACRRPASSWCRRPIALPSARCSRA